MKNLKIYLLVTLFVMLGFSCSEDLLDVDNPNTPTVDQAWKTEQDAEMGLNAAYNMFYKPSTWTRWIYFRYDLSSDEGHSTSPWGELADWTRFRYFNYNFWDGNNWHWRDFYKAIFRANQAYSGGGLGGGFLRARRLRVARDGGQRRATIHANRHGCRQRRYRSGG